MAFRLSWPLLLSVLVFAGCDCGDDSSDGPDDTMLDGDVSDGNSCVGRGGACANESDCCEGPCEGGLCTTGSCAADGVTCGVAGDCCSGACGAGNVCVPRTPQCAANGQACGGSGDCCSGNCDGAVCAPGAGCSNTGAVCAASTDCCSGNCANEAGTPCTGGSCNCAPPPACAAESEACSSDGECCNGLCDRPGGGDGTCADIGACLPAGEPCGTEGLSGSCCSTVCLNTDGTEPRCQFLGGCRVQDELCESNGECCSSVCEVRSMTMDGRPIKRCANADSCLPPGEVCGDGGASSNCCPNGGGDTGCEPTGAGFRRCLGGDGNCTLPGRPCENTEQCCMETFPNIMCQPGVSGANVCCLADGESCAFGDVCCGGICVPDPADGVLRCGAMCVPDGGACTTAADCCGCGCVSDGAGNQVCTSDPAQCENCAGPQLGQSCDVAGEPCCNAPAVMCNDAVEFSTCILAP